MTTKRFYELKLFVIHTLNGFSVNQNDILKLSNSNGVGRIVESVVMHKQDLDLIMDAAKEASPTNWNDILRLAVSCKTLNRKIKKFYLYLEEKLKRSNKND